MTFNSMQALIEVIFPVFLVIGLGYLAVCYRLFSNTAIDGLMRFTQNFAFPCLLFSALSSLNLAQNFDLRLLASFYIGAVTGFLAGLFGARLLFHCPWEEAVAIGFCGLFSNSLLLGLPITERAYGVQTLQSNYAIIALHSPFCYTLGITVMEIVRGRGRSFAATTGVVLTAMFRNALLIGIILGLLVNLSGIPLPTAITDAVDLMKRAALPAALFGLGGVLYRYRPKGDMKKVAFICAISLILHPMVTWFLSRTLALEPAPMRAAVLTAAMAPGLNSYIFANLYGVARHIVASTILLGTAGTIFTALFWLAVLG